MNNPNTILEFFGIIVGVMIIMAVGSVLIGSIYDKLTNKNHELNLMKEKNNSIKTSNKEIRKKPPIDTFVRGKIHNSDDYSRYSEGSPGETSRVITKNYFTYFFNTNKNPKSALQMLHQRNLTLIEFGVGLDNQILKELASVFYNEISYLIFAIANYEENVFKSNSGFFDYVGIQSSYIIIAEEYNKICPYGLEESTEYDFSKYQKIKEIFYKYDTYL